MRPGEDTTTMARRLPPSEYGGSDTTATAGIQPAPHQPNGWETMRLIYRDDPLNPELVVPPELGIPGEITPG